MDLIYRFDPFEPILPRRIDGADAAIQALLEGNAQFAQVVDRLRSEFQGTHDPAPFLIPLDPMTFGVSMVEGAAVRQSPFALVLGCSDARVPVELIFQQSCNDLFVVRVAGNVLGVECLGSVDFAVRKMSESLKLVVVLGHSGCGAVTAAVDMYLEPTDYPDLALTHGLRSLIDRIMIAVRGSSKALDRALGGCPTVGPEYRASLIEVAVFLNAALTAYDLKREIESVGDGSIEVVYGVFDIETQRVRSRPDGVTESPLAPAPRLPSDFDGIAAELAKTEVAKGLK
jgi:carbonic anhydrase